MLTSFHPRRPRGSLIVGMFMVKLYIYHEHSIVPTIKLPLGLRPGGALPYITYTGMYRPTGSWFWSSWFRTGYPFQRRFLERGIIFRTHESSNQVSSHLKLFKDRLLLKIRFHALTSKLLYSCCTLCFSVQGGRIWREPRALTAPSWIIGRAEVWIESIMYPRGMETGSKERDGGGEGKSLA